MSEGTKFDNGKKRWDLLPFGSIDAVASVLTFGAGKYGDRNWEDDGLTPQRIEAALGRHYSAHMQGEYDDQESGLPHLAHVACCALMALAKYERFGFYFAGDEPRKSDAALVALHVALAKQPAAQEQREEPCCAKQERRGRPKKWVGVTEASRILGLPTSGNVYGICDGRVRSKKVKTDTGLTRYKFHRDDLQDLALARETMKRNG